MYKVISLFIGVILVMQGCSLAPRYEQPELPVPETFPEGAAYDPDGSVAGATEALTLAWQNFFTDERLKQVIALALENNRDLRIAALNVQQARALYGVQRAELFPTVESTVAGSKGRISGSSFGGGGGINVEQYSVDLGISSWEIDFFGHLRSLEENALEQYLATEEARRSTQISLIFEVANAYLALAADRENLQLAQTTYEAQSRSLELIQKRVSIGYANELDLQRARTQVETARVNINRYTQLTALDENLLQLLVGSTAPIPADWLPANLDQVTPLPSLTAGLPSEVLLHRPDILAAEHQLKAAYANIGAARAAFFPRISLTAAFGTASGDLTDLFSSGTETWSFAPQLVMPIFDSRLRSAYDVSQTDREIALAQYERSIQSAFREVADALAVQGTVDQELAAQQALVDANARTYHLSELRYSKGIDSYLNVLDAQRSLYASQQELVSVRLKQFVNLARLYAVLGGGAAPAA